MELHITGDPAADQLLSNDAFALLVGMLLDQQVTMESAFAGPERIRTRIGSMTGSWTSSPSSRPTSRGSTSCASVRQPATVCRRSIGTRR